MGGKTLDQKACIAQEFYFRLVHGLFNLQYIPKEGLDGGDSRINENYLTEGLDGGKTLE